ncbi:hypothetical protein AMQ83_16265 [Paenibacillus riograndensis]|nr:hypothetical protein AMQ83_16265 [Paenibacillus riograndensis]
MLAASSATHRLFLVFGAFCYTRISRMNLRREDNLGSVVETAFGRHLLTLTFKVKGMSDMRMMERLS